MINVYNSIDYFKDSCLIIKLKQCEQFLCKNVNTIFGLIKQVANKCFDTLNQKYVSFKQKKDKLFRVFTIEEKNAAQSIQKAFRKHIARKEKDFYKAQPFVDNPSKREGMPRANDGKTPVFFPNQTPSVVLKAAGSPGCNVRLEKMKQARELCKKIKAKHLVIPKAISYNDFLIEERLPLKSLRPKVQAGLYLENCDQFNEAVREFTRFYCESSFSDFLQSGCGFEIGLANSFVPRYDNVPLFITQDGKKGKIGLIDLERFSPKPIAGDLEGFRNLVDMFPYHLDIIIDEGRKYCRDIDKFKEELMKEKERVLVFFKRCYQDHRDFLKKNEITLDCPSKSVEFPIDRMEEFTKVIAEEILAVSKQESSFYFDLLGNEPEKTLKLFLEQVVPQVLENSLRFISEQLKQNAKIRDAYPEFLMDRTLEFSFEYEKAYEFQKTIECEIRKFGQLNFKKEGFATLFSDVLAGYIFKGLAKIGVISSFHDKWCGNKKALFY